MRSLGFGVPNYGFERSLGEHIQRRRALGIRGPGAADIGCARGGGGGVGGGGGGIGVV
jgi:hypothetical protein